MSFQMHLPDPHSHLGGVIRTGKIIPITHLNKLRLGRVTNTERTLEGVEASGKPENLGPWLDFPESRKLRLLSKNQSHRPLVTLKAFSHIWFLFKLHFSF